VSNQPSQVLFRFAPRHGADPDARLDLLLQAGDITLGRSPQNTVRLAHASVRFFHAMLSLGEDGLRIQACEGATVEGGLAKPGDTVRIGIFCLTCGVPGPDGTAVIVVTPEEMTTGSDSISAAWYERAFAVELPNVRLLAFSLCGLIAVLCFVLPLGLPPAKAPFDAAHGLPRAAGRSATIGSAFAAIWNVGVMSRPHSGFGAACGRCHIAAFQHVPSAACLTCHRDIGQHASPVMAPTADITKQRCETCHREHKGLMMATRNSQSDCSACHRDIHAVAPASHERPVEDFARAHPDFAPSLVVNARLHLVAPAERTGKDVADQSGLRFTHRYHLGLKTLNAPGDSACAQCHAQAPGGAMFKRVDFEASCARCHTLPFEPRHPEWRLPHGHPEEVAARISGYYARAILTGERFPAPASGIYAQPGVADAPPPPQGADLVAALTQSAMASSIRRSDCGECHVVGTSSADGEAVAPVYVPDRYLPRALFSHAAHSATACADCHAARTSNGGVMALLPGIAMCRQCHAGEAGGGQRVASTCVSCHWFHDPRHPPISAAVVPVADMSVVMPAHILSASPTRGTQ
jgi:hypothetical protein